MSQFSQKYYKHYFIAKKREVQSSEFDFWIWSSRYKFFEIIVILLLLLILFCVCSDCLHKKELPMPTQKHTTEALESTTLSTITLRPKLPSSETFEEKLPKQVLPELSKLIPKEEVTLEKYMYYVNDTKQGYPNYVDAKTNRMIKEKRPSCKGVECPVSGITQADKQDYAQWLSEQSGVEYKVTETSKGFLIHESK